MALKAVIIRETADTKSKKKADNIEEQGNWVRFRCG
jgi:hypothetical protein